MRRSVLIITAVLLVVAALTVAPPLATNAFATCNEQALFGNFISRITGPNPLYMAAGDFNEDGILDLAVTNSDFPSGGTGASLAILIGTGARTYAAPVNYAVGLEPHAVITGDFNEDGITDLVVANKFSRSLSVLIGQGSGGVGNGTFAPAVHYPAGGYPFQIVAEDFDRDGITDLAVSLNSVAAIAVFRGRGSGDIGNGTFDTPILFPLSQPSTGLEHGDFNGDGIADLVATENGAGTIAVLLGTGIATLGSGSFSAAAHFSAGPVPFEMATGDFNGDGRTDLAVANNSSPSGGTAIMLGTGTGAFQAPTFIASGNSVVVTTDDLNQDGILDLIVGTVTGTNNGNVLVYLGQGTGGVGNGTFGAGHAYGVGGDTYQILPGDFDGDGLRDLFVSCYLNNFISLLPGLCAPDERAPALTRVRDVPADQGGRVFLTWTASSLDVVGGSVNNYRVWRRVPPAIAAASFRTGPVPSTWMRTTLSQATGTSITYWEALATLPAQRLQGYGYTAATTQDSMASSNPYTAFFVSALTSNIDVFYSSNIDSSYSVDNLSPGPPAPFVGVYSPSQVSLHWAPAPEADFAQFKLYRGASADFTPAPGNLILVSADTGFVDASALAPFSCYKLSAVDIHGNQGPFALVAPHEPTPTQASLVEASADGDGVHVVWYWDGGSRLATAYRRTLDSDWTPLGPLAADGTGKLRLIDDTVVAGVRYGYRLGFVDNDVEVFAGETWIDVKALELALAGAIPNPSPAGSLRVGFELPTDHRATLDLADVSGRVLMSVQVGGLGPGRHTFDLSRGSRPPAGVYFLRLAQDGHEVRTRVVLLN
jgi:hypothetical protein